MTMSDEVDLRLVPTALLNAEQYRRGIEPVETKPNVELPNLLIECSIRRVTYRDISAFVSPTCLRLLLVLAAAYPRGLSYRELTQKTWPEHTASVGNARIYAGYVRRAFPGLVITIGRPDSIYKMVRLGLTNEDFLSDRAYFVSATSRPNTDGRDLDWRGDRGTDGKRGMQLTSGSCPCFLCREIVAMPGMTRISLAASARYLAKRATLVSTRGALMRFAEMVSPAEPRPTAAVSFTEGRRWHAKGSGTS